MAAREHLRRKFLTAKVAISGANFGIADTGTLCVVESEGNGRMCLTLPQTLITVMGIEKLLPTFTDLEVFLQLLPRSSTGERMNPYTSLWTGVTPGDGPQDFHLILLDNGRTNALADQVGRAALHCIRCSACLNVCPVYARTGGHAYGSVYPGPIGAVLTPHAHRHARARRPELVPAVRVLAVRRLLRRLPGEDRHPDLLVELRARAVDADRQPDHPRRLGRRDEGRRLGDERREAVRRRRKGPRRRRDSPAGARAGSGTCRHRCPAWTASRDLPAPPAQTFRNWWKDNHPDPLPMPGPELGRGNHDHQPRHRAGQDPGRAGR